MISWQQFGLKGNPYDTLPLIEGGEFPIQQAFIGRNNERKLLDNLFQSENRFCLTICGDVGVGKTSLANFQKFIWKHSVTNKLLFSSRREIEACDELLDKKNFILEIIGSVLREINLTHPELIKEHSWLQSLNQVVDISKSISISGGLSALGFGGNFGKNEATYQPTHFPITTIESYFHKLLDFIRTTDIGGCRYSGIIVHVNNFDVVLADSERKKKVIHFFNEIRDILQIPHVYYLFLGPKNLFKDIISTQQRVKSVFIQTPLHLAPLSKEEVVEALLERMAILKSNDVIRYIKPIEDNVIFQLYDLYLGDIRSIMSALRDVLNQCSDTLTKSLSVNESMILLAKERWDRIENSARLTPDQQEVLWYIVESPQYVSQKEIATAFNKAQSNVSSYNFKPLRELGIIEEKEKTQKVSLWGLTIDYLPLKQLYAAKQALKNDLEIKNSNQLALPLL